MDRFQKYGRHYSNESDDFDVEKRGDSVSGGVMRQGYIPWYYDDGTPSKKLRRKVQPDIQQPIVSTLGQQQPDSPLITSPDEALLGESSIPDIVEEGFGIEDF
ncbi:MAG: hypothetical protein LBI55_01410 [Oscillospiraceae bacterium]|jgi:hypothetical protein|nr:hypothetical protein [Oscillospiraceae bacterium]